jgi:hypothetical protein
MQEQEHHHQQQKISSLLLDSSSSVEDHKLYRNFIHSIKTQITQENYSKYLKYYMKFVGAKTLKELVDKPQKIIESDIKEYLMYLRTKKKRISHSSLQMYLAPIRKFYYINSDYQFKWDLINLYLGNDDTTDNNDHDLEDQQQISEMLTSSTTITKQGKQK